MAVGFATNFLRNADFTTASNSSNWVAVNTTGALYTDPLAEFPAAGTVVAALFSPVLRIATGYNVNSDGYWEQNVTAIGASATMPYNATSNWTAYYNVSVASCHDWNLYSTCKYELKVWNTSDYSSTPFSPFNWTDIDSPIGDNIDYRGQITIPRNTSRMRVRIYRATGTATSNPLTRYHASDTKAICISNLTAISANCIGAAGEGEAAHLFNITNLDQTGFTTSPNISGKFQLADGLVEVPFGEFDAFRWFKIIADGTWFLNNNLSVGYVRLYWNDTGAEVEEWANGGWNTWSYPIRFTGNELYYVDLPRWSALTGRVDRTTWESTAFPNIRLDFYIENETGDGVEIAATYMTWHNQNITHDATIIQPTSPAGGSNLTFSTRITFEDKEHVGYRGGSIVTRILFDSNKTDYLDLSGINCNLSLTNSSGQVITRNLTKVKQPLGHLSGVYPYFETTFTDSAPKNSTPYTLTCKGEHTDDYVREGGLVDYVTRYDKAALINCLTIKDSYFPSFAKYSIFCFVSPDKRTGTTYNDLVNTTLTFDQSISNIPDIFTEFIKSGLEQYYGQVTIWNKQSEEGIGAAIPYGDYILPVIFSDPNGNVRYIPSSYPLTFTLGSRYAPEDVGIRSLVWKSNHTFGKVKIIKRAGLEQNVSCTVTYNNDNDVVRLVKMTFTSVNRKKLGKPYAQKSFSWIPTVTDGSESRTISISWRNYREIEGQDVETEAWFTSDFGLCGLHACYPHTHEGHALMYWLESERDVIICTVELLDETHQAIYDSQEARLTVMGDVVSAWYADVGNWLLNAILSNFLLFLVILLVFTLVLVPLATGGDVNIVTRITERRRN